MFSSAVFDTESKIIGDMYPDDNYDEPSGKVLPRILRNGRHSGSSGSNSRTDEIEAQLQATVRAWQTLQQQIQRGEDHYVEESGSFNIYKGWDGFIDARLFETMPKRFDYRWFSSSVSHTLSHQVSACVSSRRPPDEEHRDDSNPSHFTHRSCSCTRHKMTALAFGPDSSRNTGQARARCRSSGTTTTSRRRRRGSKRYPRYRTDHQTKARSLVCMLVTCCNNNKVASVLSTVSSFTRAYC
jgi:hypothetical protein